MKCLSILFLISVLTATVSAGRWKCVPLPSATFKSTTTTTQLTTTEQLNTLSSTTEFEITTTSIATTTTLSETTTSEPTTTTTTEATTSTTTTQPQTTTEIITTTTEAPCSGIVCNGTLTLRLSDCSCQCELTCNVTAGFIKINKDCQCIFIVDLLINSLAFLLKSTLHSLNGHANYTILELADQLEEIITPDNVNMVIFLAVNYLHLQPIVDTLKDAFMTFMVDGVTEEGIESLIGNITTEIGDIVTGFINITLLSDKILTRIDNLGQSIFGPEAAFANFDEFYEDMLEILVNGFTIVVDSAAEKLTLLTNILLQFFLTVDTVQSGMPFISMAALTLRNPFLLEMMIQNVLNRTTTFALNFVEDDSIDSNVDFIMARLDAIIQVFINPETIQANQGLYMEIRTKLLMFIMTSDNPVIEMIFDSLASTGIFS